MRSDRASRISALHCFQVAGRAALSATLCTLLAGQPVLAEIPKVSTVSTTGQIQGNERVLHALNRMTFGPRPGDVAAVEKMGLQKWFEQQLNPGSIDDSALDARLSLYPATLLPLGVLQKKYPSPQLLKQMIAGSVPLPQDPAEAAMVRDQIAFYQMRAKVAEKAAGTAQAGEAHADSAVGSPASMQPNTMQAGAPDAAPAMTTAQTPAQRKARRQQIQAGTAAMDAAGDGAGNGAGMDAQKPVAAADLSGDALQNATATPGQKMSRDEVEQVLNLPPDARMQATLAMQPKDLVRFRASLTPDELARWVDGLSPTQKEMLAALPGSLRMVAQEAMASRLDRDLYSNRQLEAVMTDFWLNHFNVYVGKNQNEPYLLPSYERDTIRPHALGRFEDLLVATAKSPAMLQYLDNFRSEGPDSDKALRVKRFQATGANNARLKQAAAGLNENYGRELMELHTLGVNGGYTQADVTNLSKVFTGWTIDRPYMGGGYVFDAGRHEPGSKLILGRTIAEGGEREGLEVLHMLATSPATAKFISTKLAVRFVSDDPPQALVDRMAAAFLKSDGDIKVVLRTMFNSPEFWSPAVYRAKVKTPLEFVVSAVRASDLDVDRSQALVQSLAKLGMPLYGMQTPNGYSWRSSEWVSTGALVSRMNFSLVMSDDRMPGTRTEWSRLLGEPGAGTASLKPAAYVARGDGEPAMAKEKRLELILLGQPVSEKTRATVLAQSNDTDAAAQAEAQFDIGGQGGKAARYAPGGLAQQQKRLDRQGVRPDDPQAAVMAGLLLGSPEFQRR